MLVATAHPPGAPWRAAHTLLRRRTTSLSGTLSSGDPPTPSSRCAQRALAFRARRALLLLSAPPATPRAALLLLARPHPPAPPAAPRNHQGGIYHGRILLPAEYPFKPPSFMMLTPNGRFQTGVKICLSISSHHPEHWQPSWSVRTALTALIAFMPTPGQGALGSIVSRTALHGTALHC